MASLPGGSQIGSNLHTLTNIVLGLQYCRSMIPLFHCSMLNETSFQKLLNDLLCSSILVRNNGQSILGPVEGLNSNSQY